MILIWFYNPPWHTPKGLGIILDESKGGPTESMIPSEDRVDAM